MPPQRVKTVASISVGEFFKNHADKLNLVLLGTEIGFDRPISEPAMNRPGLALAGFFSYFAPKRVQVLGNSELSYLKKLPDALRSDRFRRMCDRDIPCIVVARGADLGDDLLKVANQHAIPVFGTSMVTMNFLNAATIRLEHDFAPSVTVHGCMVDMRGIGILIIGRSGAGKSETAIGLIERGASLVADDMVSIKYVGGELVATAPALSRGYMEIRGIGIIHVPSLFGAASVAGEKQVDLIITLRRQSDADCEADRVGGEVQYHAGILDVRVPQLVIPVAPGRDLVNIVETAAHEWRLRLAGHVAAQDLDERIKRRLSGVSGE